MGSSWALGDDQYYPRPSSENMKMFFEEGKNTTCFPGCGAFPLPGLRHKTPAPKPGPARKGDFRAWTRQNRDGNRLFRFRSSSVGWRRPMFERVKLAKRTNGFPARTG